MWVVSELIRRSRPYENLGDEGEGKCFQQKEKPVPDLKGRMSVRVSLKWAQRLVNEKKAIDMEGDEAEEVGRGLDPQAP